ncbi:MAG: PAS domain-containing protein [Nostoc sp.]|uniref:PAS domain-containing protein n=1 Tax=Nostoc sp. TaxID=1180 RepID=UPI002FFC9B16
MVTSTRYSTDRYDKSNHLIGVSVNSTSHVAEVALREGERRFRTIFNATFQFIGLLITEGIVLKANQTALNFSRLQPQDVVKHSYWEIWWTLLESFQHLQYLFFSRPAVIYICKSSEDFGSKFMNENFFAITGYLSVEKS